MGTRVWKEYTTTLLLKYTLKLFVCFKDLDFFSLDRSRVAKSSWRGIHCNNVGLIYMVPGLGRRLLLQPTPQRREEPKPQGLARAELSAVHGGAIYGAIQPSRSGMLYGRGGWVSTKQGRSDANLTRRQRVLCNPCLNVDIIR